MRVIPIKIKAQALINAGPTAIRPKPQQIVDCSSRCRTLPDKAEYGQLMHYAATLPALLPEFRTHRYRVSACSYRVWIRAYPAPNDPSRVRFDADSDAKVPKGLVAILRLGLSGEPPAVIAAVPPDFQIRLKSSEALVSEQRQDGFRGMLKLIKAQVQALSIGNLNDEGDDEILGETNDDDAGSDENLMPDEFSSDSDDIDNGGKIEAKRKREILEKALNPVELEVEDIARISSETHFHFKVRVVSEEFQGKRSEHGEKRQTCFEVCCWKGWGLKVEAAPRFSLLLSFHLSFAST